MTIVKYIKLYGPEEAVKLIAEVLGLPLPEDNGNKASCAARKLRAVKGKSVPTSDRIKIPSRIINDCKKAVKEKEKNNMKNKKTPAKKNACPKCKPAKPAAQAKKKPAARKPVTAKKKVALAPLFSANEQKKILALRKKGLSVKAIGKAIKRRDKSVSAFLKTANKAK